MYGLNSTTIIIIIIIIISIIPEKNTGKARNQVTTESSQILHRTHASESTDVKVQHIGGGKLRYMQHKL